MHRWTDMLFNTMDHRRNRASSCACAKTCRLWAPQKHTQQCSDYVCQMHYLQVLPACHTTLHCMHRQGMYPMFGSACEHRPPLSVCYSQHIEGGPITQLCGRSGLILPRPHTLIKHDCPAPVWLTVHGVRNSTPGVILPRLCLCSPPMDTRAVAPHAKSGLSV